MLIPIQIQLLLKLNLLNGHKKLLNKSNSNTTLVKVKLNTKHYAKLPTYYSNTTLVKVKFDKEYRERRKKKIQIQLLLKLNVENNRGKAIVKLFKYNSC